MIIWDQYLFVKQKNSNLITFILLHKSRGADDLAYLTPSVPYLNVEASEVTPWAFDFSEYVCAGTGVWADIERRDEVICGPTRDHEANIGAWRCFVVSWCRH